VRVHPASVVQPAAWSEQLDDARYAMKREFYGRGWESARAELSKFYSVNRASQRFCREYLLQRCRGRRILDSGCGEARQTFLLARHGAAVTGIDLSEDGIARARARAAKEQAEAWNSW